ncbi:MFS transporter [Pseudomonas sp. H11T01]|uniref:MFS transporter n=1 Tax=Pseudomonas sp. H11T01 TaxID=3402749 RepID=UPI003ABEAA97
MNTNVDALRADVTPRATTTTRAVVAAAMGTVFEWYEFTLYGALTSVIALNFFTQLSPTVAFVFALLTFAVGFIMRPLGAIIFGRIGDRVGRKKTFLITVVLMGGSTVAVGFLPTYATIGVWAPVLLIIMRILQGLAIGGEYGGAATYVAEHSAKGVRGLNTSWISATGVGGLLASFGMVMLCRAWAGDEFNDWGWRVPFLFSAVLLAISLAIRLKMDESPAFVKMKTEDRLSDNPLREVFTVWANIKQVLIAFFGVCGGMACCYYVAMLYPAFFMTQVLKVDPQQATSMLTLAMVVGIPVFLVSGWMSDKIGRKPVLLAGFVLTAVCLFPIFKSLALHSNPDLVNAQEKFPIVLEVNNEQCSFMFNPTGTRRFVTLCDVARQALSAAGVSYTTNMNVAPEDSVIKVGSTIIRVADVWSNPDADPALKVKKLEAEIKQAMINAGYPAKADPNKFSYIKVFLLLTALVCCGVITYAPVSVILVEMFPARIRYTGMSFPYHLASGWVGGLLPTVAFALSAQAGDIYFGLWYPLAWAVVGLVISLVFLKETKDVDISK